MKWLYYRLIYRRLMRWMHRHNLHYTRTFYPDGDTVVRCDWCGLSSVMRKANYKPAIYASDKAAAAERSRP